MMNMFDWGKGWICVTTYYRCPYRLNKH